MIENNKTVILLALKRKLYLNLALSEKHTRKHRKILLHALGYILKTGEV